MQRIRVWTCCAGYLIGRTRAALSAFADVNPAMPLVGPGSRLQCAGVVQLRRHGCRFLSQINDLSKTAAVHAPVLRRLYAALMRRVLVVLMMCLVVVMAMVARLMRLSEGGVGKQTHHDRNP
jgi:hypothetical protein